MMLLLHPPLKHCQEGICHLHSSRQQDCNLAMEIKKKKKKVVSSWKGKIKKIGKRYANPEFAEETS